MSIRTGVFIKYVVEFPDAKLKVSNDIMAGDISLDADINVRMSRGTAGATFEIKLYDLPEPKVKTLAEKFKAKSAPNASKPHVKIQLGYLDTKVKPVLDGICESLKSEVDDEKMVTTLTGREAGRYACDTSYSANFDTDSTFGGVAKTLLEKADFPPDCLERKPHLDELPEELKNPHFRASKVIGILDELAKMADAELLVIDKTVFLGKAILYDQVPAATFDSELNLVKFEPFVRDLPGVDDAKFPEPVPGEKMEGFKFNVLGDPTLRPAQKVMIKHLKGYDAAANPEFRIRNVEHRFSSSSGYVCEGVAAKRQSSGAQARALDAAAERSAAGAARDIGERIREQAFDNPVIEVGAVKSAADSYRAELYYAQPAPRNETQPSVNVAVEKNDDHVYASRPIASPFAWRKCGLVTPVYPGMKAVIAHNRSLASDGIICGYLWSNDPDFAPPANERGDWWLCLPIDFDASQPPADDTNAANDLTANDGRRVLELKGLKVTVGAKALGKVGKRPEPGPAEECTLAHASGSTITIKDGEISLDTGQGAKITLSASGITLTDGTLSVELKGGQLKVG